MASSDIILAIDGTNRVHRLWHVMHHVQDCVRQFVRDVGALADAINPAAVLVAFDSATCFRRELEPSYKLGRAVKEAGLIESLESAALQVDQAFPTACVEGFEADDVLATAAFAARSQGLRCVIASPDKDLRQCLVQGQVTILKSWKGHARNFKPECLTAAALESEYGICPDQWIDYQCLVGDATDGIRGAEGIGPKTASKLLFEAGSIERLLENRWLSPLLAKSERLWISLKEFEGRLPIVRQLVTLRTDVPGVAVQIGNQSAV